MRKINNEKCKNEKIIKCKNEKNSKNYLAIKLFLLKKTGIQFEIVIRNSIGICEIGCYDIPELNSKEFSLKGIADRSYSFLMYYRFIDNGKNSKRMYFCASNRCIKENDDDDLNFSSSLPNNYSLQMMVCSKYLDERNGDDRSTFEVLEGLKSPSLTCPVTMSQIKKESLSVMNSVILERFPEIVEKNEEEVRKAIDEAPHLAAYIRNNVDVVKSSRALVKEAETRYEKEHLL